MKPSSLFEHKNIVDAVPTYMKIYHELKEGIVNWRLLPGARLPSETELTKRYGVSRFTIQHAFQLLVNEGLVIRQQGKASFVRSIAENDSSTQVIHLGSLNQPNILLTDYCYHFSNRVRELTAGNIEIHVHHSSSLGDGSEQIAHVAEGTQDMFCAAIDWLAEIEPNFAIVTYPFLFHDIEHLKKAVNHELSSRIHKKLIKNKGVRILANNWYRPSRLLVSRKPLLHVNDLNGLRIGIPSIPLYEETWESLGAIPVLVNFGERFSALQSGIIDVTDVNWDIILSENLQKVAPYALLTNHLYSGACITINENRFRSLRSDTQNALIQAATDVGKLYSSHIFDTFLEHKKQLIHDSMVFSEINIDTWREKIEQNFVQKFHSSPSNMQLYNGIKQLHQKNIE